MIEKKKLPIGEEFFRNIRTKGFYYVDKTGFISELLKTRGSVNLFTRPRRFGKSLNIDMLKTFFEFGTDAALFEGLGIAAEKELCEQHMGKYPVISISLKDVGGEDFQTAYETLCTVVSEEAARLDFLLESERLMQYDKVKFERLAENRLEKPSELHNSLKLLTRLLRRHYGTSVVVLIDEYDVPLDKAYQNGYYPQMVNLIRSVLSQVLKTNENLEFAVITGCLQIAKESIFTGLNNFKVRTVSDVRFAEYFGFTDREVKELLDYYDLGDKFELFQEWYDGYRFGNTHVYCPWDVLNHCDKIKDHANVFPENYWINTSSNDAVKKFIQMSDNVTTKREIENLLSGEEITKEIHQELIYPEMYQSLENVWSLLFMTGYLTQRGRIGINRYKLAIPNLEIRNIFETQIMEYFKESVAKDGDVLSRFCDALKNGEETKVEEIFEKYLKKTISIRDTFVRKATKEKFYHGILLGILGVKEEWYVSSNQEAGEGYSDILIETENSETVILIEVKYANDGNLDQTCERALQQIEEKKYDEELRENGVDKILKYGISCYMKRCKVKLAEE